MSPSLIRNLNCKPCIDWLSNTSPKEDEIKAFEAMKRSPLPESLSTMPSSIKDYCQTRQWNGLLTTKDQSKLTPHRRIQQKLLSSKNCKLSNIPLLETVGSKQYVFGRVKQLKDYYQCPSKFNCLMAEDWDFENPNTLLVNDLFVYCSQDLNEVFPIRVVTHPVYGIKYGETWDTQDVKNNGIKEYCDSKWDYSYPHYQQIESPIVLSRELCQLTSYFKMFVYQSQHYLNLFFMSKFDPLDFQDILDKLNLKQVLIE